MAVGWIRQAVLETRGFGNVRYQNSRGLADQSSLFSEKGGAS